VEIYLQPENKPQKPPNVAFVYPLLPCMPCEKVCLVKPSPAVSCEQSSHRCRALLQNKPQTQQDSAPPSTGTKNQTHPKDANSFSSKEKGE